MSHNVLLSLIEAAIKDSKTLHECEVDHPRASNSNLIPSTPTLKPRDYQEHRASTNVPNDSSGEQVVVDRVTNADPDDAAAGHVRSHLSLPLADH